MEVAEDARARTQRPVFHRAGGYLCLDFTNTVHRRRTDQSRELLRSYADLVSWSKAVGLITDLEARRLTRAAKQRRLAATRVLQRALILREVIYAIFTAVASRRSAANENLTALNEAITEASAHRRLVRTGQGLAWGWTTAENPLGWMLWPVAHSAADLLIAAKQIAIRQCIAKGCGWLFVDRSHSQRRKWCVMKACGNREKWRRHYRRRKELESRAETTW